MKPYLFINAYTPERPSWYAIGQQRLKESAETFGVPIICAPQWPYKQHDTKYAIKAEMFRWAIENYKDQYDTLIWADCSAWFVKPPTGIVELTQKEGYFAIDNSPWSLAQTCNDNSLHLAGLTRNEAASWPDVATGVFGFSFSNMFGRVLLDEWLDLYDKGAFNGSRDHDGQSKDPEFKFHRQDQSAYGLACATVNADPNTEFGELVGLVGSYISPRAEIHMQGL